MNNPELLPETEIPPVEYPVITLEDAADAIERSKSAGLERLIFALGIRSIGEVAAASLAAR